jgi:hypothetical protein
VLLPLPSIEEEGTDEAPGEELAAEEADKESAEPTSLVIDEIGDTVGEGIGTTKVPLAEAASVSDGAGAAEMVGEELLGIEGVNAGLEETLAEGLSGEVLVAAEAVSEGEDVEARGRVSVALTMTAVLLVGLLESHKEGEGEGVSKKVEEVLLPAAAAVRVGAAVALT